MLAELMTGKRASLKKKSAPHIPPECLCREGAAEAAPGAPCHVVAARSPGRDAAAPVLLWP